MPNIIFDKFRGLSDSIWSGIDGSFAKAVGVDFHQRPGAIQAHQALVKQSGSTITALCKIALSLSDGAKLWFSSTDGKIWRESAGTYTLVFTTTAAAGGVGCLGAAEFNGRIYWATESRIHYITITNSTTAASWTANAQLNAHTFPNTDALYHPMAIVNTALFIGDKTLVCSISSAFAFATSGSTALNATLTILAPHRIRTLLPYDIDLVIGTIVSENVNYCQFIRWDTVQSSWQFAQDIWHNGIRAAGWSGEIPIFIVGSAGRIYYYDGARLRPWKRFPGSWSGTAYYDVNPQSLALFDDRAIIGVSNGSGNPLDEGIYDLGSYDKDYPPILSLAFPISAAVFSSVQIGAIIVDGQNLYVAWYDGTNYGVDNLSGTLKYTAGYLETKVIRTSIHTNKPTNKFFALYENLNGGSLALSYKANHATSYTALTVIDNTNINQVYSELAVDARALQIKLQFSVSGNNSPVVELFGVQLPPLINSDATN